MSGNTLKVDAGALTGAGAAFRQAGADLAGLGADEPLSEAAGVGQLATADACRSAQSAVTEATTAVADGLNAFGSNLDTAASRYETQDRDAAAAIDKCEIPGN